MTRAQKAEAIKELAEKLEQTPVIYLTDYIGLTVEQANNLRSAFRKSGVEFKVVKNTLLKRAMDQLGGYEELYDSLHGSTAVAFSEEPSAPARVLKDFLKESKLEIPSLKGAHVDGAVYGEGSLDTLAELKSKDELLGDILGLLMSPMTNIIGAVTAPGSTIAGAIKEIANKEG
ncbi:MAG: 50S ribosomal protein L10 [Rhodothermales bacterium]|nr:50S ribosomal protein L10 [Rhodothermales bacterium]MBO6780102.1 50S ribosomal protein L10 [Rhodothermales bacterium]